MVTCCGISFKKLEKRVDLFLNSLALSSLPFLGFPDLLWKNTWKLSCKYLSLSTQGDTTFRVPSVASMVLSLLFVNVYIKSLFQLCQEVMWFPLKLRPKASLSHLLQKVGLDLNLAPVAPFNASHTVLEDFFNSSLVFFFLALLTFVLRKSHILGPLALQQLQQTILAGMKGTVNKV
jgi:hypothetical protein